jgi:hypothetical protein
LVEFEISYKVKTFTARTVANQSLFGSSLSCIKPTFASKNDDTQHKVQGQTDNYMQPIKEGFRAKPSISEAVPELSAQSLLNIPNISDFQSDI